MTVEIDFGAERLAAAQEKRARALRIMNRVAALHAVDVLAMGGRHPARRRHHVVIARCQAAHALRADGFEWKEIAGFLGMKGHSLAIRSARRWEQVLAERRATQEGVKP